MSASFEKSDSAGWPASAVEIVDISGLIPYARNARTHSDAQVAQIAASIRAFGFTNPVLCDESGTIIAGHGRVLAARQLGLAEVPVMTARGWTDAQRRAYVIADNKLALNADWDLPLLAAELQELDTGELDLALTGFSSKELESLMTFSGSDAKGGGEEIDEAADAIPEAAPAITKPGDVWLLGDHRVMCGDSTDPDHVEILLHGAPPAETLHADPPYGMGKEGDGIANDNLYGAKLDDFLFAWWSLWRGSLAPNASVYVWGNAEDLWRWWFRRVENSEPLTVCNELVWDKKAAGAGGISHMGAESMTVYPHATERCLFFKLGRHSLVNRVKDDYWPGWDAIRVWLVHERNRAGFSQSQVNALCSNNMAGHWFGASQWCFIPQRHYETLQTAAKGAAFARPWSELHADYEALCKRYREERPVPYFDNTHDIMRDVWEFPRVKGDERFGHATPKPVAMIARALKSSTPVGKLVLEPFAGTGTTIIAAQATDRVCYAMELEPAYVDICVKRWQEYTGRAARLANSGETFEVVSNGARREAEADMA